MAPCADGRVYMFEFPDGKKVESLAGHQRAGVHAGRWFPDGKRIITGGQDNTARIWNVKKAHLVA